jgi:transcriptional regulator with XRE-family HTH domain
VNGVKHEFSSVGHDAPHGLGDAPNVENRIQKLREQAGLTLLELALRVGTSTAQIQRLEKGTRRLSDHWMGRIAPALGVEPVELFAETKLASVADLVGYVGAGAMYYPDPKAGPWGIITQVDAPPDSKRVVALRVQGDSLEPVYRDGDLLFFSNDIDERKDPALCVGIDCVIQIAGGPVCIRRPERLPGGGLRLAAHGHAPIDGAEVEWCVPIKWVRRQGV